MSPSMRRELPWALALLALTAAYAAASWDAWLMNFRVRALCEEDRPFILQRRTGVEEVGVPAEMARRDPQLVRELERSFPAVVTKRTRFELSTLGPSRYDSRWGFSVLTTEIAVRDRGTNQVLASTSVHEGVERTDGWRAWRRGLVPPPARCGPADRVEFVRAVLRVE